MKTKIFFWNTQMDHSAVELDNNERFPKCSLSELFGTENNMHTQQTLI